jgi:hypothetical protein
MIPATIPLFSPIPPKNTDIHRNEELHTSTSLRHRENWVSQGFLAVECDSCIPPENGGFDVRWVRFPKCFSFFQWKFEGFKGGGK